MVETLISLKEKYAFLRFGHGQFDLMNNRSDFLHEYSNALKADLKKSFKFSNKNYFKSTCVFKQIKDIRMYNPDNSRQNINLLNKKEKYEKYTLFFETIIRNPEIMIKYLKTLLGGTFVGGKQFKDAAKYLKADFVETPEKNSYYSINKFYKLIKKSPVILACGSSSSVIQYNLWQDTNFTTVDIGSAAGAIIGLTYTKWMTKENEQKILNFNKLCKKF